jgi:hypothetical protein
MLAGAATSCASPTYQPGADVVSSDDGDGAIAASDSETTDGSEAADVIHDTVAAADIDAEANDTSEDCDGAKREGCPCTYGDLECCFPIGDWSTGLSCWPAEGWCKGKECLKIPHVWTKGASDCGCWQYGPRSKWPEDCFRTTMENNRCDM